MNPYPGGEGDAAKVACPACGKTVSPIHANAPDQFCQRGSAARLPEHDVADLIALEEQPDGSFTIEPRDHGVSPCFVNCGRPACQKLGCVRVYDADHGWPS